jgi:hypothetical protein
VQILQGRPYSVTWWQKIDFPIKVLVAAMLGEWLTSRSDYNL